MVGIVVACVHEAGALEWHGGRGVDGERERESELDVALERLALEWKERERGRKVERRRVEGEKERGTRQPARRRLKRKGGSLAVTV